MEFTTDAGRQRRTLLAAAGPVAALLTTASTLTAVPGTDVINETAAQNLSLLNTIADARDRTATAGLLTVLAVLAFAPFVVGVASLVRERGSTWATWGAALATTGACGAAVANYFWFLNVRATDPGLGATRQEMAEFLTTGTWPLAVFAIMEIFLLPIGWILLSIGLARSHVVRGYVAVLFFLGLALLLAPAIRQGTSAPALRHRW